MLKIENTEVLGWEHAIRGMRNPLNSWAKVEGVRYLQGGDGGQFLLHNAQDYIKRVYTG